jgi:hypothetical protein
MYPYGMSCVYTCYPITYITGMHVHQREWEIRIELKRFNLFIFQSEVRTEILHYTIYIYKDKNTDKGKIRIFIQDQQNWLQFLLLYRYFPPKIRIKLIFKKTEREISCYHLPNLHNIIF